MINKWPWYPSYELKTTSDLPTPLIILNLREEMSGKNYITTLSFQFFRIFSRSSVSWWRSSSFLRFLASTFFLLISSASFVSSSTCLRRSSSSSISRWAKSLDTFAACEYQVKLWMSIFFFFKLSEIISLTYFRYSMIMPVTCMNLIFCIKTCLHTCRWNKN